MAGDPRAVAKRDEREREYNETILQRRPATHKHREYRIRNRFLPGPPERALEIAKKFPSYEKVTEQREFVTYKGEIENKANMAVENAIRVAAGAVKYINSDKC